MYFPKVVSIIRREWNGLGCLVAARAPRVNLHRPGTLDSAMERQYRPLSAAPRWLEHANDACLSHEQSA